MTETNKYSLFKKFPNANQANELAASLQENNISCKLVDNSPEVDITFSGNTLQNEVQVFIKQSDFEAANNLLKQQAELLIDEIDKDYYLFDFTNEELYEILTKPDEWGAFDHKLSQKILKDRGQEVNEDLIKALKKQRNDDLAKPEDHQQPWVIGGYIFAFLGGFLGILIGWYLWKYKKTLPDGKKVYAYNEKNRKQGKNIFIIGCVLFPFWFVIRFMLEA